MTYLRVTAATSAPEDVEAARVAEKVLNGPDMRRVLQRAEEHHARSGKIPSDKMMRHWMREEER